MSDCEQSRGQQLRDEAWKLKLPAAQKVVLMTMCEAADDDGVYRRGIKYIADDTEYCEVQVRRIIAELVSMEYVQIDEKGSGRKSATYRFALTNRLYKLSMQNVEASNSINNLSKQNVQSTHSQNNLHKQNVNGTGDAEERVRKDSQQTTNSFQDTGKLLVESWVMAHPENKKPTGAFNAEDLRLACDLAADGFTPEDVFRLTTEKWQNRTRKYEFRYLADDLRKRKQIAQQIQTPPSVPLVSPSAANTIPDEGDPDSLAYKLRNGSRAALPEPPPHESLLAVLPGSNITPQAAWAMAFNQLEIGLDRDNFERGLRNARLLQLDGDVFVIGARSPTARDHCASKLYRNIQARLGDAAGKRVEVRFEVAQSEVG